MESWGITHSGKVRSINQDVFKSFTDDKKGIVVLVVCDGMGGANAGNVASELAADVFIRHFSDHCDTITDEAKLDDIAQLADNAACASNDDVYKKGQQDAVLSGMGTTLVALISSRAGEIVANIGDSRAYHITPNGISQITKDHSVVEDMIDRGEITREEAEKHPRKNLITRAVGADAQVEADIYTQNIDSGDIVLLCTDGLSNIVTEDEILAQVRNSGTLHKTCQSLVDTALSRGAPDNVTVAVFRKQEEPHG